MLNEVSIRNFKSYHTAVLKLSPLTLLVGTNASGKSNAIEAIRFLSWLAEGRRLDTIWQDIQQTDVSIRGTFHDLIYDHAHENEITLGCQLNNTDEWKHFSTTLRINEEGDVRIVAESIESEQSQVPLYWLKEASPAYSHEVQVAFNNFSRGGTKPTIPCSDRQAIFTQLDVPSRFVSKNAEARRVIPDVVNKLQTVLTNILFLDPIPRHMGGYSFIIDGDLKEDGSNLSSVLYDLCIEKGYKAQVLQFIESLPEQKITDIDFIKTPRNEVMVQLVESFGNHKKAREAPLLSDGTLRVLAVTAALLSAPEGSLLIIEEIDNGIHPSRAKTLLENIQAVAQERELRVLLTSHNPALLDALPLTSIPHVVACYRDPEQGDSQLVQLADLASYPELVARGSLGQLMTNGILEKVIKAQQEAEAKKQKNMAWLARLREQVEAV